MKRADQVKRAPDQGYGERVPPGQFVSQKFPVLTYGPTPRIDLKDWKLRCFGLVENELELTWEQFKALTWTTVNADFHCVTQWSSLDNTWEGVLFTDLMEMVNPKPEANYVMAHCYGDYTTNIPLETLIADNSLLAHMQNGSEIGKDHGWPLRLVVPSKYAWKSAKWVTGIEFMAEDHPGFWEQRGYSNNADPWKEERFWPELT